LLIESFANRLKKAMSLNNIKQTDLMGKTKIDKTLINKYLAGVAKAGQDNLTTLAEALNVSEPWLLGYDVPINKENNNDVPDDLLKTVMSKDAYQKLPKEAKEEIIDFIKFVEKKFNKQI